MSYIVKAEGNAKKIGVAIRSFFVKIFSFIKLVFLFLAHLVTDNKGQGDIRAVLGIACFAVSFAIGLGVLPSLVRGVSIDLASVGTIIGVFIGAGLGLFGISKQSLQ